MLILSKNIKAILMTFLVLVCLAASALFLLIPPSWLDTGLVYAGF